MRRVVVIGAARSGTKLVRDVVAEATGAGTVPYDIGYIWRYGNEKAKDDVIEPEALTPSKARFIARHVDRYGSPSTNLVVEKTVGNSLRVPYVAAVFPDAQFIHVIRDGVDVVESTRRQWLAPPHRGYLRAKARHFPLRLAPSYGRKYVLSLGSRYLNRHSRVASWGPRYPGIDDDLRRLDLLTVCARQWRWSVESASAGFDAVGAEPATVRYEALVQKPQETLVDLLSSLEVETNEHHLEMAAAKVRGDRVGVGLAPLAPAEIVALDREIGETLTALGYRRAVSRGTDA